MCQLHSGSSGQNSAALKLSTETKALDKVSQGYHVRSDIKWKHPIAQNIYLLYE